jgi:hypothetical protein
MVAKAGSDGVSSRSVVLQICGPGLSACPDELQLVCSALHIGKGHITANMFLKTYWLKDKVYGASKVACLGEVARCAQQHGRVAIVAARVHATVMF